MAELFLIYKILATDTRVLKNKSGNTKNQTNVGSK